MGLGHSNTADSCTCNLSRSQSGQLSHVEKETSIISENNPAMINTTCYASHTQVFATRSFANNNHIYPSINHSISIPRPLVFENNYIENCFHCIKHEPIEANPNHYFVSTRSHLMLNHPYNNSLSDSLNSAQIDKITPINHGISFHRRNKSPIFRVGSNQLHSEHTTGSVSNPYVISSDEEGNDDHTNPMIKVDSFRNTTSCHKSLDLRVYPTCCQGNTNECSGTVSVKNTLLSIRENLDSVDAPLYCLNPVADINARLNTQVEARIYPCNYISGYRGNRNFTQFTIRPEGIIIQGIDRKRSIHNDLGAEYAMHIGRKLQRYEISDRRACQLLVTSHEKSFWAVPSPEASYHTSGTFRLLGDRKHPLSPHKLQVGDFLRMGSVGVVVIETHNGFENRILSEERIQQIIKHTNSRTGFLDSEEACFVSKDLLYGNKNMFDTNIREDVPVCYMCFGNINSDDNPLLTPCKCRGDTRYVHVGCLRRWHTADTDNQICFVSSVHATCSVCKSTIKSEYKLPDGRLLNLFKSSLEPPYLSLLIATKQEMAQKLFNTRFQLSFSTLMRSDGNNSTRSLFLGRSSLSDMVLDYRTISASHATIKFKRGEFVFSDVGSSNGSYLYLRQPIKLTNSQPIQFRLGRSLISMKVVSKWNHRTIRAVRRGEIHNPFNSQGHNRDHNCVVSAGDDIQIIGGKNGRISQSFSPRSRESIMDSLPVPGMLSQQSPLHLELLFALAYPKYI